MNDLLKSSDFFKALDTYRKNLSSQQYKTLRGQALAGDIVGAGKGLEKLRNRKKTRGTSGGQMA